MRLPCLRMLKESQDTKNRRGTEGCLVGHSNTLSEAEHRKLNCRPTSQMVEIHPPRNNRLRVSRDFLLYLIGYARNAQKLEFKAMF